MSGVFCMASHSVLQYLLPSAAMQLQDGCAHLVFLAISPPLLENLRAGGKLQLFGSTVIWSFMLSAPAMSAAFAVIALFS